MPVQDAFIIQQVHTFVITALLGLLIGFGYDFLRSVKRYIRFSRGAQFAVDLFFWLMMTVLVFLALLASNWGEVRMYVFIGLATGGIFYTLVLSRFCFQLMVRLLALLISGWLFITKPVVLAAKWLKIMFSKISRLVSGGKNAGQKKMVKIRMKFNKKKKE